MVPCPFQGRGSVCPGGRCGGCMSKDRLSPGGGGMSGGAIPTHGHGPEGVASHPHATYT